MKRNHLAAIVASAAAVLPGVAAAQIKPVLTTTMQRTCATETTATILMQAGTANPDPLPFIERQVRTLSVKPADAGLRFHHQTRSPGAAIGLEFTALRDGSVTGAVITGLPESDGVSDEQLATFAHTAAQDIPERLLLGRTFSVGDSYYPDDLRRDLIGRVGDSLGLPFALTGSIDVFYRGEVDHRGRRAWLFDGAITMAGAGEVEGVSIAAGQTMKARVLHDAETGLVLNYDVTMDNDLSVDGKPFTVMKMTDSWDCEIVSQ
ncbi:MAG TPA: hypothetical protein VGR32_02635 [Brevundimonas sp.]|jgi:hypothetical protein|uniref:hypothetical protein n=1 Tax=Brevundimonas sp. TaxID=1871086 RepID=UPI002DF19790|nr:hypothetical protein [Brevundimonas sp.]